MSNRSVGLIIITQGRYGKEALLQSLCPGTVPERFGLTCHTTVGDSECDEEALGRAIGHQLGYTMLLETRMMWHRRKIISDLAVHGLNAVIYGVFGTNFGLQSVLADELWKGVIKPVRKDCLILPLLDDCKILRCSSRMIRMQRGDAIALREAFKRCN